MARRAIAPLLAACCLLLAAAAGPAAAADAPNAAATGKLTDAQIRAAYDKAYAAIAPPNFVDVKGCPLQVGLGLKRDGDAVSVRVVYNASAAGKPVQVQVACSIACVRCVLSVRMFKARVCVPFDN
jgi:hypothetical protein